MVELDLNEILQDTHMDLFTVDQVTGQCKCKEYVGQNQHLCPYCKELISWKHSKLWTRTFLEGEGNNYAKRFLRKAGVQKFKDGREYHRWRLINLALSEDTVLRTVGECRDTLRKRMVVTGRATIRYALNKLEKKLPEETTIKEGEILGKVGDPD